MTDAVEQAAGLVEGLREELPSLPHGRKTFFAALTTAATPDQDLTVSEWADRYRKVSAESGSPFPGDWKTDRVPYLREPMDCLHPDHPARRVALKFSAQSGKSEVGVNWFGFIVDRAPGSILTVLPTGEEANKYNRVKLQPTIDSSPRIRHRVKPENSRDEGASTTAFKRFAGGFDQITTATSSKGLQMISVRYLILDEVSGFPRDADGRGSPVDQARARQKAFGDLAKELIISTPGIAGDCLISEEFEQGDRRRFYVPHLGCGCFHTLRYENMQPPAESTGGRVTFVCPACGELYDQADMHEMRSQGRWVPTWVEDGAEPVPAIIAPEEIDTYAIAPCTGRARNRQPSYALWSAYSPMESWGDIWQRGETARGDPTKEKVFSQQDRGEAYEMTTDTPDWEKLLAVRKPWPRGTVPWPAAVLTGFIDVQGNRFEWGLWGWGPGFQGWLIDRGIISHDYKSDEAWAAIDALTARKWPTESGQQVEVMRWGMDTGAFTQTLYDRVSGRMALQATKADNRPRAAPLKMTRADLRNEHGQVIAGRRIDLALIGQFDLKISVYDGFRSLVAGPGLDGKWGPGTLHLPDWIGEDELKQLTAEVLVDTRLETRRNSKKSLLVKPGDVKEWRKRPHQPNEGLDIAVGSRALAWGEGAGQLTAARWFELAAAAHQQAAPEPDLFTKPALTEAPPPPPPEPPAAPPPAKPSFIPRRPGGWLRK